MLIQDLVAIAKFCQNNAYVELKDLGLTSIEHNVCAFIYLHENTNQDKISRAYSIDKATVAKMISKLEKQGLLVRTVNTNNRRENLLSLTEDGMKMMHDVINVFDKWAEEATQDLTTEEKEIFYQCLDKIKNRTVMKSKKSA